MKMNIHIVNEPEKVQNSELMYSKYKTKQTQIKITAVQIYNINQRKEKCYKSYYKIFSIYNKTYLFSLCEILYLFKFSEP